MKILLAVDEFPYSTHALDEVAKLAANTWANVNILRVNPKSGPSKPGTGAGSIRQSVDPASSEVLFPLRDRFLSHFEGKDCPYLQTAPDSGTDSAEPSTSRATTQVQAVSKKLTVRLGTGNPVKAILAEAKAEEVDLIVLGCDDENGCQWGSTAGLPRKVAVDAVCSVLVVKQRNPIHRILCCLDHNRITQPSLEMINQMVTLHQAQLTIVGLTESTALKAEVEQKMDGILRYYHARHIDPWIELVDLDALDAYIAQASGWGLMALWMGKQSILERALPHRKLNKLIKGGDASVLVLR